MQMLRPTRCTSPTVREGDTFNVVHIALAYARAFAPVLPASDTLAITPRRPMATRRNWPFSLREFDWVEGMDLDEGREPLRHYISMLESGRGDEVMVDPITQRPFRS